MWQVYGRGGELLAEYAAGAAPTQPQKEYGYRGGQLLITASGAAAGWGSPPVINDNPQSLNKYQYCLNNPLRYVDPDGHDVISYELLTSGPNQVPKTPHPEVPNASTLGPTNTATGGYFVLNLRSNFDAGDKIEDYKPVRTAFILDGRGGAEVRSGGQENPSKSQTAVSGQSRSVYDNPGLSVCGAPKASIGNRKVEMTFVAGEYNTKTKQLSSTLAYYKVTLVFIGGKLDTKLSTATMISRNDFIALTGKSLPKEKKSKQPCPECALQR